MSKKELTVEERVKKHGTSIIGVGIIYIVFQAAGMFLNMTGLLADPVSLIINVALLIILILMSIGVFKRNKFGVLCGWIFETVLLLTFILSFLGIGGGLDIIGIIVAIWLPSDLSRLSKALKELK